MDLSEFIGPIFSAVCAFAGSYMALTNRITRLETKVDMLGESVEKHNNVVQRTAQLETEVTNLYHRFDDLKKGA